MKHSDILSSSTIGSSRSLSAYSATALVVLWSGEPPSDIPLLAFLKAGDIHIYLLAWALLTFLMLAHAFNWRSDIVAHKAARAAAVRDNANDSIKGVTMGRMTEATAELLSELKVIAEEADYRADAARYPVTHIMHLALPIGIGVVAWIALGSTITWCTNVGCNQPWPGT